MQRILSLSALGLLLIAGSSTAQQPAAGGGASTTPVVQSGTSSTSQSSGRLFGRVRGNFSNDNRTGLFGRRSNRTSNNVVSADTTTQPVVEGNKTTAVKETAGTKTPTMKAEPIPAPTPTVVDSTPAPTRRFGFRDGNGFLSRLGSRFGR